MSITHRIDSATPRIVIPVQKHSWTAVELEAELKLPNELVGIGLVRQRRSRLFNIQQSQTANAGIKMTHLIQDRRREIEPAGLGFRKVVGASFARDFDVLAALNFVLKAEEILLVQVKCLRERVPDVTPKAVFLEISKSIIIVAHRVRRKRGNTAANPRWKRKNNERTNIDGEALLLHPRIERAHAAKHRLGLGCFAGHGCRTVVSELVS